MNQEESFMEGWGEKKGMKMQKVKDSNNMLL